MSKNPPSIPESSIRNEEYQEPKKPVFLYVVIAVLVVAVAALGAVSFLSLSHLVTLQQKVQSLSDTVQDISTNASTLISQADQLEELREQEASVQTATDEISSVDARQIPAHPQTLPPILPPPPSRKARSPHPAVLLSQITLMTVWTTF